MKKDTVIELIYIFSKKIKESCDRNDIKRINRLNGEILRLVEMEIEKGNE